VILFDLDFRDFARTFADSFASSTLCDDLISLLCVPLDSFEIAAMSKYKFRRRLAGDSIDGP